MFNESESECWMNAIKKLTSLHCKIKCKILWMNNNCSLLVDFRYYANAIIIDESNKQSKLHNICVCMQLFVWKNGGANNKGLEVYKLL